MNIFIEANNLIPSSYAVKHRMGDHEADIDCPVCIQNNREVI
jgi:hypothetical protein